MSLGLFLQSLVNAVAIAGMYGVVASGFTLVLGVMKIFNFAHGQFYMVGAFLTFAVCELFHLPYIVAIIAVFIIMGLLGMFLERFIIRYTYAGFFHQVLATIATGMILSQSAVLSLGKTDRFITPVVRGMINVGGTVLSYEKLFLIFLSLALIVGLHYMMKLKVGKAMRAVAEDQETAELQGINARWIFLLTMGLGCGLAGVAGAVIIPVLGATVPMGYNIFVRVLIIIIIGGMGSMPGALLAALLVGLIESFGYQFVGALNEVLLLGCLIPLLLLRPGGLLGRPLAIPE